MNPQSSLASVSCSLFMTLFIRAAPGSKELINVSEARRNSATSINTVRNILIEAGAREGDSTKYLVNKSFGNQNEARAALLANSQYRAMIDPIIEHQIATNTIQNADTGMPAATAGQTQETPGAAWLLLLAIPFFMGKKRRK